MWRIRENRAPERLDPGLWIKFDRQDWYWEDANPPWYDNSSLENSLKILSDLKITALPKLADVLFVVLTANVRMGEDDAVRSLGALDERTRFSTPA